MFAGVTPPRNMAYVQADGIAPLVRADGRTVYVAADGISTTVGKDGVTVYVPALGNEVEP